MSLDRYSIEVRGVADELEELLQGALREAAFSVLSAIGEEGLLTVANDERGKALKLLSQTPSQRAKTLERLDDETAATLILRARYLGLAAANALSFAAQFSLVPGMSYRDAALFGAKRAINSTLEPTMGDVLPGWDAFEDEDDEPASGWSPNNS